jgi:hypothetical protein
MRRVLQAFTWCGTLAAAMVAVAALLVLSYLIKFLFLTLIHA